MAFNLPSNLKMQLQYQTVNLNDITSLEDSLPPSSRVLVGLVFQERYPGFEEDCQKANEILKNAGIPFWPEFDQLVFADPDGEPVAWIAYLSSPAWWVMILILIGSVFLLPVIGAFTGWVIDQMFPGLTEMIILITVMGLMMMFVPQITGGKKS